MTDERPERPDPDVPEPDGHQPDDTGLDQTVTDADPVVESDEIDLEPEPDPVEPDPVEPDPVEPDDDSADEAGAEAPADDDPADDVVVDEQGDEEPAVAEVPVADDPAIEEEPPEGDVADEPVADETVPPPHAIDPDGADDQDDHERSAVATALTGGAALGASATGLAPQAAETVPPGPTADAAVSEDKPRRRGRWFLLAAAVVLGALYVGGYFLTGTRMPAAASIGGVDVSGMSPAQARTAVEDGLSPKQDDPVRLTFGEESFEVDPGDAGLALDVDASVDQAGGARSWDPRDMVGLFFGSHTFQPVLEVDAEALDASVAAIAESVDVPVTEALITFPDAKPKARAPKDGLVVRKDDAAQLVQDQYLVQTEPVEVPTAEVEPAVDEEGLKQAMTEVAEPAVAAPVTIEVGDKSVELPVTAYAPALTIEPVDGAMAPVLDAERLAEPLTNATTGIGKKAVDATVEIRDEKPVVVPGKEGVGLQPQEMAEKLVPVLTKTGDERAVQVEAKVVEPAFTTEDAKALKITEKISEFTTEYPHAEYRNVNQGRAAEIINGTILKPKETFSFNDTVGERTAANGFTTGSVINGGRFRDELGGGVSQVVTTTYNAAFFAGLDDVEHHPHAFYIDRYPVGREATVYFGSLDLRFRNNLQNGVLIRAFVQKSTPGSPGRTTVQMWGTKEFEVTAGKSERRNARTPATRYDDAADCVAQAPLPGFDIDIYRTLSKGGKVVKRETDTAVYTAADRIICGKKPDDD